MKERRKGSENQKERKSRERRKVLSVAYETVRQKKSKAEERAEMREEGRRERQW